LKHSVVAQVGVVAHEPQHWDDSGCTLGFALLTPTYTTYAILASHLVIPAKAGMTDFFDLIGISFDEESSAG
jgi:hypothetical protein